MDAQIRLNNLTPVPEDLTQDSTLKFVAEAGSANGPSHKVKSGDKFMIWGNENASTGYSWNFDYASCGNGITLEDNQYLTKQHPRGMVGVGGKRYLTFKVTN